MSLFLNRFLTTQPEEAVSLPAANEPAAAPPVTPAAAKADAAATERRDNTGPSHESHWSATRAAIDEVLASGERDLSRVLGRIANPASDNNVIALGQIGYRVAGLPVLSPTVDGRLEQHLFLAQKLWLLQRALPAGVTDIAELGSGSGNNLFTLWLNGLSPDIRLHALEYTAAGRACAETLAALEPEMKFNSAPFDYYSSTMEELHNAEKLFVFTSYSIEQIAHIPDDFFERLLRLPNLAAVLHIEPVGWQYGLPQGADALAVELDRRMRKSVARKGYNQSLVPQLHAMAKAGRIVIEEVLPNVLAHRPDLPGTAIRWRPVR